MNSGLATVIHERAHFDFVTGCRSPRCAMMHGHRPTREATQRLIRIPSTILRDEHMLGIESRD